MSNSYRTNQSRKFKLVWFCYAICNHHFMKSNIQWCINFRFLTELIIRSWLHAFVAIPMIFLKVLMQKVLIRCKIVLRYRFRQNKNVKLLRCDCFVLLPQKFILTSFVKRFRKKFCIKSSLFCDFPDWKHVRTIATCIKKTFSSRKVLKTMFCYFWKIRSQSNDFFHPFLTFAIKVKGM